MNHDDFELTQSARCSVAVISITPVTGGGRCIAIATALILVEGVEMTLSGIRLMRQRSGNVTVEFPMTRDATGRDVPVIQLPGELIHAIDRAVRREVLETVAERIAGKTVQRH